jgi:hypothetical protein
MRPIHRLQFGMFVLLLASYAFFWQARDWNTSTRLMLTYALVDRGTLQLDGLENQTGDIAYYRSHYYLDKLPGFSYIATIPYAAAKWSLRLPDHPRRTPAALALWDSDYWVTLGTSGVATALTSLLLVTYAFQVGCRPRMALLVGLAYGLATPAYVYATLAYGHQLSALALFGAFLLIRSRSQSTGRISGRMIVAGFLAAYASVIELQVGPVSAILGLALIALCASRRRPIKDLSAFIVGAMIPTAGLLVYNQLAFGSPFEMGYFHHATKQFAEVHNKDNPLGLMRPNWDLLGPLLVSTYRGLLFYAPILILTLPGWGALARLGRWRDAVASLAVVVAVFLVNLSYPEWTGGWSTGPRLLLPLIPFAMIPVAGLLALDGRALRWSGGVAIILALVGYVINSMFVGVGGRIPHTVDSPFSEVVVPLWIGRNLPRWWIGDRFCRTLFVSLFDALPASWQVIRFAPLFLVQGLGVTGLWLVAGRIHQEGAVVDLNLVVDHQQEGSRRDQDSGDPETQTQGVLEDPGPGLLS